MKYNEKLNSLLEKHINSIAVDGIYRNHTTNELSAYYSAIDIISKELIADGVYNDNLTPELKTLNVVSTEILCLGMYNSETDSFVEDSISFYVSPTVEVEGGVVDIEFVEFIPSDIIKTKLLNVTLSGYVNPNYPIMEIDSLIKKYKSSMVHEESQDTYDEETKMLTTLFYVDKNLLKELHPNWNDGIYSHDNVMSLSIEAVGNSFDGENYDDFDNVVFTLYPTIRFKNSHNKMEYYVADGIEVIVLDESNLNFMLRS